MAHARGSSEGGQGSREDADDDLQDGLPSFSVLHVSSALRVSNWLVVGSCAYGSGCGITYTIGRLSILEQVMDEYTAGTAEKYFCDTLEPIWRDFANGAYKKMARVPSPKAVTQ